jgi:hypothetical protein
VLKNPADSKKPISKVHISTAELYRLSLYRLYSCTTAAGLMAEPKKVLGVAQQDKQQTDWKRHYTVLADSAGAFKQQAPLDTAVKTLKQMGVKGCVCYS